MVPADAHIILSLSVAIAEYMAYMLKYDSVHGRFPHEIHGDGDGLWIDGKKIAVHAKL